MKEQVLSLSSMIWQVVLSDLKIKYHINNDLYLNTGFRLLEGGVDIDDDYNFALLCSATCSIGYQF